MFSVLFTLVVAVVFTAITFIKGYEYDSKFLTVAVSAVATLFTGFQYVLLRIDSILTAAIFVLALTSVFAYTSSKHMTQQGRTGKPLKWYHILLIAACTVALNVLYELFIRGSALSDIQWRELGIRILITFVIPMSIGAFLRNRKLKRWNASSW